MNFTNFDEIYGDGSKNDSLYCLGQNNIQNVLGYEIYSYSKGSIKLFVNIIYLFLLILILFILNQFSVRKSRN